MIIPATAITIVVNGVTPEGGVLAAGAMVGFCVGEVGRVLRFGVIKVVGALKRMLV
jgi:hypothetical protein